MVVDQEKWECEASADGTLSWQTTSCDLRIACDPACHLPCRPTTTEMTQASQYLLPCRVAVPLTGVFVRDPAIAGAYLGSYESVRANFPRLGLASGDCLDVGRSYDIRVMLIFRGSGRNCITGIHSGSPDVGPDSATQLRLGDCVFIGSKCKSNFQAFVRRLGGESCAWQGRAEHGDLIVQWFPCCCLPVPMWWDGYAIGVMQAQRPHPGLNLRQWLRVNVVAVASRNGEDIEIVDRCPTGATRVSEGQLLFVLQLAVTCCHMDGQLAELLDEERFGRALLEEESFFFRFAAN